MPVSRTRSHPARTTRAVAAALGFVAGLRSQLPFVLLATAANGGRFAQRSGKPLSLLRSRGALATLALGANAELIADKLPFTPSRIAPAALAGRLVSGGIIGAAVFGEAGRSAAIGAIVGVTGAGAGSFAGYYARKSLVNATGFPDFVWAVTEDAVALGLGLLTIRQFFRE
ncbi:MAG TPA: DUF4126 family protein [Nitrolancea sp.]|nr:DUF4126 family protein [Nitrolancea sp.]